MAATTDVTELFKYTYFKDRLTYIASEEIVAWNLFTRRDMTVGGRGQIILPFQTRNTGVFAGHTEGGALTTTRAQPSTAEATFSLQEFHAIYDVSWKALRQASRSEWAFERMAEFLDRSMKRRVFRHLNAEILGSGLGEMGIMPAADDQAAVTFNSLPLVDEGMVVDVMDKTDNNTKVGDSLTVTDIDVQNRVVTFSGALSGSAATDYITMEDSVSDSAALHMLGIHAWISDANPDTEVGNIGGIDRSAAGTQYFKANVLGNSGTNRPMTETLLLQGMNLVRERGGDKLDALMTNLAIILQYHEDLRAETVATMGRVGTVGGGLGREESQMEQGKEGRGSTPYSFSNIPIHAEPFARANTIYGFHRANWLLGHDGNEVPMPIGEIFNLDLYKRTSNASFDVDHYWEAELLCDNPPNQVRWDDIAEA